MQTSHQAIALAYPKICFTFSSSFVFEVSLSLLQIQLHVKKLFVSI